MASKLSAAANRDDLQDVGRRAREVLIVCARILADGPLVPADPAALKVAHAKHGDLFIGVGVTTAITRPVSLSS